MAGHETCQRTVVNRAGAIALTKNDAGHAGNHGPEKRLVGPDVLVKRYARR